MGRAGSFCQWVMSRWSPGVGVVMITPLGPEEDTQKRVGTSLSERPAGPVLLRLQRLTSGPSPVSAHWEFKVLGGEEQNDPVSLPQASSPWDYAAVVPALVLLQP